MDRFDKPVMNNVCRGDYVECMVVLSLGRGWALTWQRGWEWAPWDCEHDNGARLEIKQSAARQSWDADQIASRRSPAFDIAPRTGRFSRDGSEWIDAPGRPADVYVFAWHGERERGVADHRDPQQWQFYVSPERELPDGQKRIGLRRLREIVSPCRLSGLRAAILRACPASEALKATLEHVRPPSHSSNRT